VKHFCILGLAITTILLQGMHEKPSIPAPQAYGRKEPYQLQDDLHKAVAHCNLPEVERLWARAAAEKTEGGA
jgi:hypothetical protein